MEDSMNSLNGGLESTTFFAFESPKDQSSYIKVIGVGGGGGNAVNHMFNEGINGVDFIVCNTDMKALDASPVPNKISLGALGAGNKPEKARKAAMEKADDIREVIAHNTQMLFITAGMGGGTGTGAAPVIAEIAKSIDLEDEDMRKILVVAIVTLPFSFEGTKRLEQAQAGLRELSQHVDSIIVINNDKLRSYFGNLKMSEAFAKANDVLLTAAKGIAEIITNKAYVNIDLHDVNTVMENSGTALMGTGSGRGENRAHDAIEAAASSVLLDDSDISGAKNVLLYFSYSKEHEMTMDEQAEITDYIQMKTNGTADFIWGAGTDDSLDDELKVILIATGFEKSTVVPTQPTVIRLQEEPKVEVKKEVAVPVDNVEPFIVKKEELVLQPSVSMQHSEIEIKKEEPIIQRQEPQPAQRNVFVLEDEAVAPAAPTPQKEAHVDALEDDIHLVAALDEMPASNTPEPIEFSMPAQQAPSASQQPAEHAPISAFQNMNDERVTRDRAERIKFIHEQLRNNPNGAEVVQSMTAQNYENTDLFEGTPSNSRDASHYTMRADGTMVKNAWLGDQPD